MSEKWTKNLKTTEAQNDENAEYADVWYTTGTRHFHHFVELQRTKWSNSPSLIR
jgi:hypothetical protein